jgi:ATP-binding cassette, subfamily B, bacterial
VQVQTKETLKIFWHHVKLHKFALGLTMFGIVGGTIVDLFNPVLAKKLFDNLASGVPYQSLFRIALSIFAVQGLVWFLWRIGTFANTHYQLGVKTDLIQTCFNYIHKHSFKFFSNNFTGSLVRKVSKYDSAFENLSDQLQWSLIPAAIRIIGICLIVYFVNPIIAYVMLGWSILYVVVQYRFAVYKIKYDIIASEQDSKVIGQLADAITNNTNIKAFGGYGREQKAFGKMVSEWFAFSMRAWNFDMRVEALQAGLIILLEFLVIIIGLRWWRAGLFTIGDFALLQGFLAQLFSRLWDLGRNISRMYRAMADANEMTEILLAPHEVADAAYAKTLKVSQGKIEFKQVSFSYYGSIHVFKNFNLDIAPGERIAFVGPSGGGKTTITKLLLRFYDLTRGQILIDGQDISQVTQDSLRDVISYVPQEPILFHRTLMENIRYAKPKATQDEVVRAAKLAHCHEFINTLPDKYNTFVGERGIKLSGGERQRVAIARAILKDAPILVLDEATSSLDSESEKLIQDALQNLMKDRTTIVIAHRLSTIMQMDRIVVIQKGAIIEQGKHEELLKAQQGIYQKLWEIQAGGFG